MYFKIACPDSTSHMSATPSEGDSNTQSVVTERERERERGERERERERREKTGIKNRVAYCCTYVAKFGHVRQDNNNPLYTFATTKNGCNGEIQANENKEEGIMNT